MVDEETAMEALVTLYGQDVNITTSALRWWQLATAVQLACRHPQWEGDTRMSAESLARGIFEAVVQTAPLVHRETLREFAEMGWSPELDQEWSSKT